VATLIVGVIGVGIGWLILYSVIQSAVRDGVGKALRDHDQWRRENAL
jgi:hypothetical protein